MTMFCPSADNSPFAPWNMIDDSDGPCICCGELSKNFKEDDESELYCPTCNNYINWSFKNTGILFSELPEDYFQRTCFICKQTFSYGELTRVYHGEYDDYYQVCKSHLKEAEELAENERLQIEEMNRNILINYD